MPTFIRTLLSLIVLFCFTKTNAQWIKQGISGVFSEGKCIATDNVGNIFTAGTFTCNTQFDTITLYNITCGDSITPPSSIPRVDLFINKYDKDGNIIWSKQILGEFGDSIAVNDIAIDNAGNCYITGQYSGNATFGGTLITNSNPISDLFIAKYLANGTFSWVQSNFNSQTGSYMRGNGIATDMLDNCYVTGAFFQEAIFGTDTFQNKNQAFFITKLNTSGVIQSAYSSIGDTNKSSTEAFGIITDLSNDIYITGIFTDTLILDTTTLSADTIIGSDTSKQNIFLAKYNNSLKLKWVKTEDTKEVSGIAIDNTNRNIFISGSFIDTSYITTDTLITIIGNSGAFIAKYDSSGNFKWTNTAIVATIASEANANSIDIDELGNSYISGYFGKTATSTSIISQTESATSTDDLAAFISKYDSLGNIVWIQALGYTGIDKALDINVFDKNNAYITGLFIDSMRVVSNSIKNEGISNNMFVAEIDTCPQLIADINTAASTEFCAGDNALLQASAGPSLFYSWMRDGVIIAGATNSTYTAIDSASFQVLITDTALKCSKLSNAIFITVNPLPIIPIYKSDTNVFCNGDSIKLSTDFGNYTYQWLQNNIPVLNDTNFSTIADTTSSFSIEITDSKGCVDTSIAINVSELSFPTANTIAIGSYNFCQTEDSLLVTATETGMNYQWKKDGINLSADTFQQYTILSSGIFSVDVSNTIGCTTSSNPDTVVVNTSPPATIDSLGPLSFCDGGSTNLLANSGLVNVGLSFQWRRNNIDILGATLTSYVADTIGNYEVVVSNAANCTRVSPTYSVNVFSLPNAIISPNKDTNICNLDTLVLIANTGAGLSYQWQKDGGNISGATNNTYDITSTGQYLVKVSNTNNCTSISSSILVSVISLPSASISALGSTTLCTGDSVQLKANVGSNLKYQWLKDGINLPNDTNILLTVLTNGNYTVLVSNSNNCNLLSTATPVTVFTIPPANITSTDSNIFCGGDSIRLQASTGGSFTYQWQRDGFDISNAIDSVYTAFISGAYTVIVAISSNCTNTSPIYNVNVLANPKPIITQNQLTLSTSSYTSYQWNLNASPIAGETNQLHQVLASGSYTVSTINVLNCTNISDPFSICVPIPTISANGNLLTSSNADSYQWYIDDILIPGANGQTHLAQTTGQYKVETILNGCQSFSSTLEVCVPAPTITLIDAITLQASTGSNYQWYLDDILIPGATTQIHIVSQSGAYSVEVSNNACSSISHALNIVIAGINSNAQEDLFSVYPNPNNGYFNIRSSQKINTIKILDVLGKTIKQISIGTNQTNYYIDISSFNSGLYFLQTSSKEHTFYQKVIKK